MNAISSTELKLSLPDEQAMSELGADIAMACSKGGLVFLQGDLGAGKTTLARALIRQIMQVEDLEVPSPTFSLIQHYELDQHTAVSEVMHADLYRIGDPAELEDLGLDQLGEGVLALVEWPERSQGALGEPDLFISLDVPDGHPLNDGRTATISGKVEWVSNISRSLAIRKFLTDGWGENIKRIPLMGDASTRSYEFVRRGPDQRILMNAPRQPDGPIIKDGKPYSQIANLAEDISAFIGVDRILNALGLRVPALYNQDMESGLLLLEDLGDGKIIDENRTPIEERYLTSSALLAEFHEKDHVRSIKLTDKQIHNIPDYDRDAMMIEVDLLRQWYAPSFKGSKLSSEESDAFEAIWNELITGVKKSEKKIVLRDFHSPNIIWMEQEAGNKKAAVIDFQDAVIGPSAYDLASLAQDARGDVSERLEAKLLDHYCNLRSGTPEFDEDRFRQDYAIMAALRATKILGIFVRLNERDNKPQYLAHLPRMQDYIKRSMRHPVLNRYKQWYETVMEL